jgi:glycosyltransferase involved in cell wall biosynthesis
MRIGWDATPLLGLRTGVGNYSAQLLAALLEQEPDWDFLLYSNHPLASLESELHRAVRVHGYLRRSRWLWMQLKLPWLVGRTRPDLCHFTNSLAPLYHNRPYVLTIHDASLFLYSRFHPWARLLTIRLLLPLVARRAEAVITVSEHARQDLVRVLGLPPDRVHVVHEAAAARFRPVHDTAERDRVRQRYGLPERYLLYLGTLEPRKNLGRLLSAIQQLRRDGMAEELVLVGKRGWLMNGFERQIEASGLTSAVRITGFVPAEDLPAIISAATLFVFPSLYEGFGLPPLEAMACGTPVLASNRASLPEVCGDAAEMVDPANIGSIAEAISRLLADEARRSELRCRGFARARQFSWQRAAQETAAIYRQVWAAAGE